MKSKVAIFEVRLNLVSGEVQTVIERIICKCFFFFFVFFFSHKCWIALIPTNRSQLNVRDLTPLSVKYTLFFYKNIFYKNIEAEICEILRIF